MNKIYKVIWSKVRNCYVAVSEIAKRNGKSCACVNCGAKAKGSRGLRMATVMLGVTAALVGGVGFGSPVACADGTITVSDASQPLNSATGGTLVKQYGYLSANIDFFNGYYYYPSDSSIKNLVITGGSSTNAFFAGFYSLTSDTITGYSLKVSEPDTRIKLAIGAYTASGTVSGNEVTIENSKVDGSVFGGYSQSGTAGATTAGEGNNVIITGGTIGREVYGGYVDSGNGNANGNSVTLTGSSVGRDGAGWSVRGGSSSSGDANDNRLVITGSTLEGGVQGGYVSGGSGSTHGNTVIINGESTSLRGVYGGDMYRSTGKVENNTVIINDGTIRSSIFGGRVYEKATGLSGNAVIINGGTITSEYVYGGSVEPNFLNNSGATDVTYNTVVISGGTFSNNEIYGGRANQNCYALNNIIDLTGTVTGLSSANLYGGKSNNSYAGCTGNELHIGRNVTYDEDGNAKRDADGKLLYTTDSSTVWQGKTGGVSDNTVKELANFETISLHSVAWNPDVPALKANTLQLSGGGTALDITDMVFYDGEAIKSSFTAGETMTLLKSVYNVIDGIKLKYNDEEAVSLVNNPVTIGGGAITDKVIITDLLKFSGTSTDTVSLATDNKAIIYTAGENAVTGATFNGTADWNTGAALYINSSYKFDESATTSLAGLKFSDTTVTEDPIGKSMTLISGNVKGTVSDQPTDASIDVSLAKNNTTLGGKATGEGTISDGNLTYTINKVALDSVAVTAAGDSPDELPTGWTKGSGITVDTGTTALDLATGATILTSETEGLFTGATFSGVNDYNDAANNKHAFASDIDKGVTLDGTQQKGIKASDDGKNLVYAVNDTKDVATITLGTVNTKDPRDVSGTSFDFGNTAKVDASNLKLEIGEPANTDKLIVPLVTNAANLAAGVAVDYGTGKTGHSQDISLTHGATGIGVGATVTGTVATATGAVNYTVTGAALNSVDLSNWNGTAAGTLPAIVAGSGVAVTTGNFTEPTLAAGQSIDIITTTTENFFGSVTGDKEYKKGDAFDDSKNGVTLSGNKYGGVKTNDTKTTLTYYAESMKADKVAFGEMTWNTGRAAAAGYDFTNVTDVDASKLTFTNPEAATGSMDLLTGATNLAENVAVDYGTGKTEHSQDFDKTLGNKAVVSATLTGTVDTATAGKVSYTATGTSMSKIDLAKWDGSSASAVPTGWTLASSATIETGGMNAPSVDAGKHIDIVQSDTDNFFANATITGGNEYKESKFNETDSGIQFEGTQSKGVTFNGEKNHIIYAAGTKDVSKATVKGTIAWKDGGAYYENTKYTFSDSSETDVSGVKFTADTDPLAGSKSMTLITDAKGTVTGSPEFAVTLNNTTLEASATGSAAVSGGNLNFTVTGVTLDKVTVSDVGSDAVPEGWTVNADGVAVETDAMTAPTDVAPGEEAVILTGAANTFKDNNIKGENKYGQSKDTFSDADTTKGVTLSGTQDKGVKASEDGTKLVYAKGLKDTASVTLGATSWQKDATLLDGSAGYDYAGVTKIDAASFAVTYEKPENVAAGESMTLLKANETLSAIVNEEKQNNYNVTPVAGVTVDATITGKLTNSGSNVVFTAAENKAATLTFGDVDWKDSGALIEHKTTLANVSFDGAAVDTTKINFTNKQSLEADQQMTLVSDFGGTPGSITGDKYKVGTAYEGEGSASMDGDNLIFKTKTGAGRVSDETHNTVMAMEAGMALLNTGSEYVGKVLDGLGEVANAGKDGVSTAAAIGGGKNRYETGSHISTHTWNAAVAVGTKRDVKGGSLEYGVFGEYGKGNYTLHSDDGRGDGDAHYAGGGLMAKWTNKHDVYTEASFRLGRMSDSASDILHDGAGNGYGYNVHANYYGAHVGVGKVFNYEGGRSLDVYGKYFYTKRNSADFTAGIDRYSLDSVASSILRIGAKYGTTDKRWNWYGGLAYEYEFDGKAEGTVNGTVIRSASVKGSSVRGEIGMRMNATKTNPWQTDISLYGYAGKHRGFGGNVNVAYMF